MHPQSPHRRPQAQPTLRRTPTRADKPRTTQSTAPHRRYSRPLFCQTICTSHTCAAIAVRGSHHGLHRRPAGPSDPIILRSHPRLQHSVNGDHFRLRHSVNAAGRTSAKILQLAPFRAHQLDTTSHPQSPHHLPRLSLGHGAHRLGQTICERHRVNRRSQTATDRIRRHLRHHHSRGGGRLTTDHARTVSTACAQRIGHHEPAVRRSTVPSAQRPAQVTLRRPDPQHHFRLQHSVDAESMLQDDHLPS